MYEIVSSLMRYLWESKNSHILNCAVLMMTNQILYNSTYNCLFVYQCSLKIVLCCNKIYMGNCRVCCLWAVIAINMLKKLKRIYWSECSRLLHVLKAISYYISWKIMHKHAMQFLSTCESRGCLASTIILVEQMYHVHMYIRLFHC